MYRILIVDDEPEVTENLYELLMSADFNQLDIVKTYSSREALSIANSMKIDILLTDIRMPGVNGLQLAETAKNNWPKCRIIFLTGYNEFDYAYAAIKVDCDDYILKTASNREIIQTIKDAVDRLDKSLQDEQLMARTKEQMQMLMPWLQKEYMLNIIEGELKPSEIVQERFNELEIALDMNSRIFLILGRVDELLDKRMGNEYMIAIRLIAEEAFSQYPNKILIEYDSTSFICLIQDDPKADNNGDVAISNCNIAIIKGAAETMQNICHKSLNTTISLVLCSESVELKRIAERFSQLKKILDFSSGIGREAFLTDKSFLNGVFDKINTFENNLMKEEMPNLRNVNTLVNYLDRGMSAEYFQLLSEILACLKDIKSKNNFLALEIYYTVSSSLLSYINRWKIADSIAFKIGLYKLTRVDEHETWNDAVKYIIAISKEIFDTQKSEQAHVAATSVKYVQQYILNHISEDLSLTRLADLVYLNPSYLSRLFKQVTGMNVSEYLVEARIEKSKALLIQTDLKVHELAAAIGFESPTYFGRIFKKATNMTPQEYRELNFKR